MLRDPGDRLEGDRILSESPGELGLLLWRTARDVTLWGTTPEELRENLFADCSAESRIALLVSVELPGRVAPAVDTLNAMLGAPGNADAEIASLCSLEIAAWARDTALPHTAVAFAQAGAVAAPRSADPALFAGVCARVAGQPTRADTWMRRAVAVARREKNWSVYSSALVELGALYESRGNLLRAERFYRRAMRASRRHSNRAERMRAAHALFRLARQEGDKPSAAQFALSAQRVADPDALGAAEVLIDLARFWLELDEAGRARSALRRLVPALVTIGPAGQLTAFALTARARAEPGRPQSGGVAWRAAWVLLLNEEIPDAVRYEAATDLAHAARNGGDLPALRSAMRVVLRLAPQSEFPDVADRMARLAPEEKQAAGRVKRAS
jgi:tetratricopeptide (TPR) repeat protein